MKKLSVVLSVVFIISLTICLIALTYNQTSLAGEVNDINGMEQSNDLVIRVAEVMPEYSNINSRAISHFNSIDNTINFTESIRDDEENKTIVEEHTNTMKYDYLFTADILDIRTDEHVLYNITVNEDKSYKITVAKSENGEPITDETDKDTYTDTLGDSEFAALKRLLNVYKDTYLVAPDETAEYDCSVMVGNSNTVEETFLWVAKRLLNKEVERLDENKGIIKVNIGFDDIYNYVSNDLNSSLLPVNNITPDEEIINVEEQPEVQVDDNSINNVEIPLEPQLVG